MSCLLNEEVPSDHMIMYKLKQKSWIQQRREMIVHVHDFSFLRKYTATELQVDMLQVLTDIQMSGFGHCGKGWVICSTCRCDSQPGKKSWQNRNLLDLIPSVVARKERVLTMKIFLSTVFTYKIRRSRRLYNLWRTWNHLLQSPSRIV